MNIIPSKKNFLGDTKTTLKTAKVIIIPFGLEKTVSFGKGTSRGPSRIIEVSSQLELFDEELEIDTCKVGIATMGEPKINRSHNNAILQLEKIVEDVFKANKFPLVLGGEHSLTLGPVRAVLKKYKNISILHFDAHSDLRDSYEGDKLSHGAVMRRCFELGNINLVQVGIRNISNTEEDGKEFDFYQKNKNKIKIFWAKDMVRWQIADMIRSLSKNVYLSFDVDAFDPSLMPSTGTPEPGGIFWWQALKILKAAAKKRNIIGVDIVELAPIKGLVAPDFLTAKLAYKIIGYVFNK